MEEFMKNFLLQCLFFVCVLRSTLQAMEPTSFISPEGKANIVFITQLASAQKMYSALLPDLKKYHEIFPVCHIDEIISQAEDTLRIIGEITYRLAYPRMVPTLQLQGQAQELEKRIILALHQVISMDMLCLRAGPPLSLTWAEQYLNFKKDRTKMLAFARQYNGQVNALWFAEDVRIAAVEEKAAV